MVLYFYKKILNFNCMKKIKNKLIILIFGLSVFVTLGFKVTEDGDDFELIKNLEIYHNVLKMLKVNYVDDISSRDIITLSINQMLEKLDPYTTYYPESQIESIRLISENRYVGIGISIDTFDNKIYVVDINNDSYANKVGVMIGDVITSVNNIATNGQNLSEFDRLIQGQANTTVDLEISRNGEKIDFSLKREPIEVPIVTLVKKIDDFGYIKLDAFSNKAFLEFKTAFLDLKKQDIEGLIIDLRDNPGGLLEQAVEIIGMFIDKNKLVVASKGKSFESNSNFSTHRKPLDKKIPIVVLVNGSSASASEIVSGTLQDYDRAVIIGQNTFGKGLVQRIFNTGYNTKTKITISKYYIPSGRCIQAIDYTMNQDNKKIQSDTKFYTANGRVVYEGNGIKPDVTVANDTFPKIINDLVAKKIFFHFATSYYQTIDTASIKNTTDLCFDKPDIFIKFLEDRNYFETLSEIKELETISNSEFSDNTVKTNIAKTKTAIIANTKKQIKSNFKLVSIIISKQMIKQKYLHKGEVEFALRFDSEINQAKYYLSNTKEYNKILNKK